MSRRAPHRSSHLPVRVGLPSADRDREDAPRPSIHTSWPTVRDTLKSHQICTVVLPTDDGSVLRIRKAATPEPDVHDLYRTLGIASQIISPPHTWTQSHSD